MMDCLLLYKYFKGVCGFVAKAEVKKIPLVNLWMNNLNCLYVDRDDIRDGLKMILAGIEKLKSGISICIMPEGTRSKSKNDLLDFHHGSFRCALRAKCPVVPIALVDCFKVLDQEGGSKPVTAQIHYLTPIFYEEYKDLNTKELAALVRERIETKVQSCIN